jgi:membrane protease YdiL (CAAX protease family)
MKELKPLGVSRPLIVFFGLAFGLSWGNAALTAASPSIPFLFPYGPLVAALIVASATAGRAGLKELARRCLRWRVGPRWYAAAILVPVAIAFGAVGLNLLLGATVPRPDQLGQWYRPFLQLPEVLVDAPLGEESGWRGYALPLFPAGRSALTSSLALGALIAAWHLPVALGAPAFVPYVVGTIGSAILANWVYYNARGSALLVILYHTAQNAVGGWYLFRLFTGDDLVWLWWLWGGLNCVAAAGVVVLAGPTLIRGSTAPPGPEPATR